MEPVSIPTYEVRLEEFKKVKTRILSILLDYPEGLTHRQLTLRYIQRFNHVAILDNRLRELRKDGEVESYPGQSGVLVWKLTSEWKPKENE